MSVENTWVCDGCGKRHEGKDKPMGWAHLTLSVSSTHQSDEYEDDGDFCDDCRIEISGTFRFSAIGRKAAVE